MFQGSGSYYGGLAMAKSTIAIIVLSVILIAVLIWAVTMTSKSAKFAAGDGYSRFSRFSPAPAYTNAFRGGVRTDPTGSDDKWYNAGPDTMNDEALKGLFLRGSSNPVFNVGGKSCRVSPTNNCPAYVEYGCNDTTWSNDATGELLALTATGSYAAPSLPTEPNLERIVGFSYDIVDRECADANVRALYNKNMNTAATASPSTASFYNPNSVFGM